MEKDHGGNGLERGTMCPHVADDANVGVKAPPTGLAPVGGGHVYSI